MSDNNQNNTPWLTYRSMQTNMTSARLFIKSEKLAHADDEFAKQLKVCAKAWGDTMNIHCECRI